MLQRILSMLDKSGLTDAAFCKELSLANGTIGKWRSGKQKPSLEAVIKIASYFGVSIDYLVWGEDIQKTPDSSFVANSYNDDEWLCLIHSLPLNKQYEFYGELVGYLKALEDSKKQ